MRYSIVKYFLIAAAFSAAITSCKKQLDLRPTDQIDELKAFLSVEDLRKGARGVYSAFGGAATAGVASGYANNIWINALVSDELKLSNENRGQGQFYFKFQISASAVTNESAGDYLAFYTAIDRAHRVMEAIDRVPAANAAEEAEKKVIRAELLAFRGMAHFELLRRYMPSGYDPSAPGVPVILKSDLFQLPARNTVGEVIAQVESDFAAARAIAEFPNVHNDGLRVSKAAVAGYQARVAQLKREWQNAVNYATEALTLSGKTLATRTQYGNIWTDASTSEVFFRLRNDYNIQLLFRDTNGDVFFEPSDKLKNQYNRTTDIRFSTFFGQAVSGGQNDTSIITKYPGNAFGPDINDIKVLRASEMYLIRAEAYAELNQLDKAADEINALRSNRISGYTNVTFATKDEAINAIMNERFKELAYEGFRFFDLKRRGLGITRLASDALINWRTLDPNDYRFALPIPESEIFANPNTKQNTGY